MESCTLGAPRALAEIDIAALTHNYLAMSSHCGGRTLCVVKADAYGHGISLVVPALSRVGCDFFAVACLEEALSVRALAPRADILILGYTPVQHAALLAHNNITQAVFSPPFAAALSAAARAAGVCVRTHVKIDTGMCRLGFSTTDKEGISFALHAENLHPWGAFTHFPRADTDPDHTMRALRDFLRLRALFPKGVFLHAAASAAALTLPASHLDGVRIGIALYGHSPVLDSTVKLSPVMQLTAPIISIKSFPAGTPIGYGGAFVTTRTSHIGTLPIGYADGLMRSLEGLTVRVLCKKEAFFAPLVGHICMDQSMIDLTDAPRATVGDRVHLFYDINAAAKHCGSIPYEILSAVSSRVERREKEGKRI